MKTIYIATHPEATHHTEGLVGGWYDSELTARGRDQAAAMADAIAARLDGASADVVASDLRRTAQTAEAIAARVGEQVRLDADLREKSYGEAEGRPQAWLARRQLPLPADGDRLRHDEGIAGAETRWDLAQRAYAAMARVVGSGAEHTVVVTHGGPSTLLLAAWIEMPIEACGRVKFGMTSGGISVLRRLPGNHAHEVTVLNDRRHLRAVR